MIICINTLLSRVCSSPQYKLFLAWILTVFLGCSTEERKVPEDVLQIQTINRALQNCFISTGCYPYVHGDEEAFLKVLMPLMDRNVDKETLLSCKIVNSERCTAYSSSQVMVIYRKNGSSVIRVGLAEGRVVSIDSRLLNIKDEYLGAFLSEDGFAIANAETYTLWCNLHKIAPNLASNDERSVFEGGKLKKHVTLDGVKWEFIYGPDGLSEVIIESKRGVAHETVIVDAARRIKSFLRTD